MKRGIVSAAARMLLIQGSMNYERLQGIGAAVAIEPLIRDLDGGPAGSHYRDALGRSAGFFNTNPFMAGLALGAVARAEHSGVLSSRVERLRSALKGPLGSLGDRLIWTGALPAASAVGFGLAILAGPIVGVLVFLIVFNVVHLTTRWWGLSAGWRAGTEVAKTLSRPALQKSVRFAGPLAALLLGMMLPVAAEWLTLGLDGFGRWGTLGVAGATFAVLGWLAPSLGGARLGIMAAILVLGLGWI